MTEAEITNPALQAGADALADALPGMSNDDRKILAVAVIVAMVQMQPSLGSGGGPQEPL